MVVEFLLDYVERAGRFDGRGKNRALMLSGGSLDMTTGTLTPHVEAMVRDVTKIINGEATYTPKDPPVEPGERT